MSTGVTINSTRVHSMLVKIVVWDGDRGLMIIPRVFYDTILGMYHRLHQCCSYEAATIVSSDIQTFCQNISAQKDPPN